MIGQLVRWIYDKEIFGNNWIYDNQNMRQQLAKGKVESEKEWVEKVETALNSRLISNWWIEVTILFFTAKILSI